MTFYKFFGRALCKIFHNPFSCKSLRTDIMPVRYFIQGKQV